MRNMRLLGAAASAASLLVVVVVASAQQNNSAQKALIATGQEKGWIELFDGKSMEGWEVVGGGNETHWEVKDGLLCGSGKASMLVSTKGPYKNFRFRAELPRGWKTVHGDNGSRRSCGCCDSPASSSRQDAPTPERLARRPTPTQATQLCSAAA